MAEWTGAPHVVMSMILNHLLIIPRSAFRHAPPPPLFVSMRGSPRLTPANSVSSASFPSCFSAKVWRIFKNHHTLKRTRLSPSHHLTALLINPSPVFQGCAIGYILTQKAYLEQVPPSTPVAKEAQNGQSQPKYPIRLRQQFSASRNFRDVSAIPIPKPPRAAWAAP